MLLFFLVIAAVNTVCAAPASSEIPKPFAGELNPPSKGNDASNIHHVESKTLHLGLGIATMTLEPVSGTSIVESTHTPYSNLSFWGYGPTVTDPPRLELR